MITLYYEVVTYIEVKYENNNQNTSREEVELCCLKVLTMLMQ